MAAALAARDDQQLFAALAELPIRAAPAAAPAPPAGQRDGSATASLVLGIIGIVTLLVSIGFLSVLTLPMSATAWGLGRSARRAARGDEPWRSSARTGEILGIVGTVLSTLTIAGCVALITAV